MFKGRCDLAKVYAVVIAAQCFAALTIFVLRVPAQQLAVRRYNMAEGLAHNRINYIYQDRKGYMWFATWEGLSRFDGYEFTNYGMRDGIVNPLVNAIAEDRQGRLWITTHIDGVARLVDVPRPGRSQQGEQATATRDKFVNYSVGVNTTNTLLFDANDSVWCGTGIGLYRGSWDEAGDLHFEAVVPGKAMDWPQQSLIDARGHLWFANNNELIRVIDNRITQYRLPDVTGHRDIVSILEQRPGSLLVAHSSGIQEFLMPAGIEGQGVWRRSPLTLLPGQTISSLTIDSKGVMWVGTTKGLIKFSNGVETLYTSAQGLSDDFVTAVKEDREGNLWIGTQSRGVCKLTGELIVSFTRENGLPGKEVSRIIESNGGLIYASTENGVAEIEAGRVTSVRGSERPPFNNIHSRLLRDSRGDWWAGTERGLFQFKGPKLQFQQGKRFGTADGISDTAIMDGPGIYEDSARRIWVSSFDNNLYWFDPARKERPLFQHINLSGTFNPPLRLFDDRTGALWLAQFNELARLINGKVELLEPTDGLPETRARCFFRDSRGRLWIGLRYRGVSMVADPTANPLKFINYSIENGLSSDSVWSITEDDYGRIYLGTGRGLDQLDTETGRIRHFTTADGLAGESVYHCIKDSRGYIWIATTNGVSRLDPRAERRLSQPPPVYLSRVQIAGEDLALPETGSGSLSELRLPASRNNLLIEYVALSFKGGQALRYQYRLEGTDADWSAPTEQRSVNYAELAPGSYRFLVRAISQDGTQSAEPAVIAFRILPPFWQQWWFVAAASLIVGLAVYSVYRYRVRRLIELERVRTRIATDLHDDIGSNLSRIAMLSEVMRRQGRDDSRINERLSLIAGISRETVDSMSDIVWAVNPTKDRLSDLSQRMRRVAGDLFAARNIELRFSAPDAETDLRLGADVRREVFLIFKEAVNNMLRHSGCTQADIEFRINKGALLLKLSDNGKGFNQNDAGEGNGLLSMRVRAERLGGRLELISDVGAGTTILLKLPLRRRARHS